MSFLGLDFKNVYEPKSVKEGEYQLRVINVEVKDRKNAEGKFVSLKALIVNEPEAKDVNQVMMLPTAQDDAKQKNKRLSRIQNLITACGCNPSNTSLEDLIGTTFWAILTEESDPEYGTQNKIKKFIVGK